MLNEKARIEELLKEGFYTVKHEQSTVLNTNSDGYDIVVDEDSNSHISNKNSQVYYTQGLSDVRLLVKYFSNEGMKPKAIKENIIRLWHNYDSFSDYKALNSAITNGRKNVTEILDINEIEISEGAIDWFLNCGLSWPRTKYLFTLYVWNLKNQTRKNQKFDTIYMQGKHKMLKSSAKLSSNFNKSKENAELRKLGYLEFPMPYEYMSESMLNRNDEVARQAYHKALMSDPYKLLFLDKIVDSGEMIKIGVDELPGEFITKIKKEKKVTTKRQAVKAICPVCGKEFDKISNNPDECCADCKREKNRIKVAKWRASKC